MPRRSRAAFVSACLTALLVLVAAPPAPAVPPTPSTIPASASRSGTATEPSSATKAIGYVVSTQADDGGFFGVGQPAAISGGLADTLVALAVDEGADRESLDRAIARLASIGPSSTTRPAYTARIVMAVVASGYDASDFGGVDYEAELARTLSPAGYWETQNYANALAALGWAAAGHQLGLPSVLWMAANQCADGGWGFALACGSTSDVDTTALTLNAVLAGGVDADDPVVTRARGFLLRAQNSAGGFGDRVGTETNANSTGLALSAIAALGEDPRLAPWNHGAGRDPRTQLLALQTSDGGFLWKASRPSLISNYATVQAVPGVAGVAYPVPPRASSDPACTAGRSGVSPPGRCARRGGR